MMMNDLQIEPKTNGMILTLEKGINIDLSTRFNGMESLDNPKFHPIEINSNENKSAFRISLLAAHGNSFELYITNIISYKGKISDFNEDLVRVLNAKSMWRKVGTVEKKDSTKAEQIDISMDGNYGLFFNVNDEKLYYKSLSAKSRGKPLLIMDQNQTKAFEEIKTGTKNFESYIDSIHSYFKDFLSETTETFVKKLISKIDIDKALEEVKEFNIKDLNIQSFIDKAKKEIFENFYQYKDKTILDLINELTSKFNPNRDKNQNSSDFSKQLLSGDSNSLNDLLKGDSGANKGLLLYFLQKIKGADGFGAEWEKNEKKEDDSFIEILEELFKEFAPQFKQMSKFINIEAIISTAKEISKDSFSESEQTKFFDQVIKILDLVTENKTLGEIFSEVENLKVLQSLIKLLEDPRIQSLIDSIDFKGIVDTISTSEIESFLVNIIGSLKNPLLNLINKINDKPIIDIKIISALYRLAYKDKMQGKQVTISSNKELISFGLASIITLGVPFLNSVLSEFGIDKTVDVERLYKKIEAFLQKINMVNKTSLSNQKLYIGRYIGHFEENISAFFSDIFSLLVRGCTLARAWASTVPMAKWADRLICFFLAAQCIATICSVRMEWSFWYLIITTVLSLIFMVVRLFYSSYRVEGEIVSSIFDMPSRILSTKYMDSLYLSIYTLSIVAFSVIYLIQAFCNVVKKDFKSIGSLVFLCLITLIDVYDFFTPPILAKWPNQWMLNIQLFTGCYRILTWVFYYVFQICYYLPYGESGGEGIWAILSTTVLSGVIGLLAQELFRQKYNRNFFRESENQLFMGVARNPIPALLDNPGNVGNLNNGGIEVQLQQGQPHLN